ncbi:hypothetical protein ACFXCZ_27015 [Streptomyces sp. NPDC059396]|uniref:hypothetical protein n=1 Tax=Streptomyces sp. NPDC059396 TaxID=3346819 RepID=UPI0036B6C28F
MTAPPPEPGVYISQGQVYQEVRVLSETVGRIEHKLDGVLADTRDIRGDVADHESRLRALEGAPKTADIEPRVTSLERNRWPLHAVTALAAVAAVAIALYR